MILKFLAFSFILFCNHSFAQSWKNPKESMELGLIKSPKSYIEISLSFDQDSKPNLKVLNARNIKSSKEVTTTSQEGNGSFKIELLDKNKTVLFAQNFKPSLDLRTAMPKPNDPFPEENLQVKSTKFILLLPLIKESVYFRILENDTEMYEALIDKKEAKLPKNNFKTIRGNEFKKNGTSMIHSVLEKVTHSILELIVSNSYAQTSGTSFLDIAIIGDGYSDLTLFHSDANNIINQILLTEPYKSRASQILFHVVDNTKSLSCKYDATIARLLVCDNNLVYSELNSAGVPYDIPMVVVNSATYGGSGGPVSVVYNGGYSGVMMIHEFGHTLGSLLDEYNLYTTNGVISNLTQKNCYAGSPPNQAWPNTALSSYALGCNYPNWYRSTPSSVMLTLSSTDYNQVSQALVNSAIDRYTNNTASIDKIAPTLTLISPISGSTLSSITQFEAQATDNIRVASVKFVLDGKSLFTFTSAPYTFKFDTNSISNGLHTLNVIAVDDAGNSTSASSSITIKNNSTDTIAPTLAITSPLSGSTITGKNTLVTIKASDNVGVVKVKLFDNGKAVAESIQSPFSMKWNTTKITRGVHTLEARAYDSAGNEGISSLVTVYY